MAKETADSEINEILSLESVRTQAQHVLEAARNGLLNHFDFDESRMPEVADFVMSIISRDFGPDKYDQIPPHGRWQQFNTGSRERIGPLLEQWTGQGCDQTELARRMVDLLFVSVLMDAGAGDVWQFREPGTGQTFGRSEGIALATLHMFSGGKFQSQVAGGHIVDARGLANMSEQTMEQGFQISGQNEMTAFSSRVTLLNRLGQSLLNLTHIFGDAGRPGNLVDYLLDNSADAKVLDFAFLWQTLQQLLLPVWPETRPHISGRPIGDAWPLRVLAQRAAAAEGTGNQHPLTGHIQPFHKLTQWLAYSLKVPFVRLLDLRWRNEHLSTGLAEYRNGGIFVDIPVLRLKPEALRRGQALSSQKPLPQFDNTGDEIVEWRAMTVALLDELHNMLQARFKEKNVSLTLGQMLEAGTFKAGRELAAKFRPATRSSPILISGDGTLF
ncbi:uncharacterized protein Z520_04139 [Fonsecaea multimorphosa CBS 102226]|uniref:Uracil catabolism protein 4 n=1 Tax=Fonsecaea multimorphosa CBS 102226 TaxID=1442371 RepID=A0A0D2KUR4_9EURO|nr:uncharacterized protein Z520_04139 [Fonsecaea multimorphosa CBS 102226]KIY00454.1 hypothetical protein Z520_04139 [Fonsecaea multimorphosa CBS 102226]OAL26968.1 hypothetical protein AYO22_03912 [Fonsecaea multimorphosa]